MFEEGKRYWKSAFICLKAFFFVFHVLLAQSFNINFFHEFSLIYSQVPMSPAKWRKYRFWGPQLCFFNPTYDADEENLYIMQFDFLDIFNLDFNRMYDRFFRLFNIFPVKRDGNFNRAWVVD